MEKRHTFTATQSSRVRVCDHLNPDPCALRPWQDPELLSFIDIECYCWSTVLADFTPMINSGMVFCDRHYGGINYPKARRHAGVPRP